jgi:hypothetical protein
MQTTKIMEQKTDSVFTITFTEEDKVRGIGALFRSRIVWNGIGQNKFVVRKQHLELFKNKNIKYRVVA